MERRPSLDIAVLDHVAGSKSTLRVLAKPCRNLGTRYWVVLPPGKSRRQRWLIEPSVEQAVRRAAAWLLEQAHACFGAAGDIEAPQDFPDQPAPPLQAAPIQPHQQHQTQ